MFLVDGSLTLVALIFYFKFKYVFIRLLFIIVKIAYNVVMIVYKFKDICYLPDCILCMIAFINQEVK